jgi:hypothetical protein
LRFRSIIGWTIGVLLVVSPLCRVQAQTVYERMVMPGPLIEGHAKLEKDCANCHEPFAKTGQTKLCLSCHKEVAADRQQQRGIHGRRKDTSTGECRSCHTDHKGRGMDIVQLDRETFNHTFTNFEIKGAHKQVSCAGCHVATVKFRNTPGQCIGCHKKTDPHKGNLGEKCDACHSEEAWRRTKPFDHAKTKFPLEGAHAKVVCAICHVGERYKDLATTCVSCHRLQDVHRARYGAKCETCHSPKTWPTVKFDHAKATKFPLLGAHAKAKCDTCHAGNLYKDKLTAACVSCHKKDDPHKGQLGARCAQCHNETGWRQKVVFDHDITRFPLVGLHAAVPCEECHRTPSFKDAPRACNSCHKDEHHARRLGTGCALCHNPNGWSRWRFEHDKQTRYPLTGAHKGLQCHACHRTPNIAKITVDSTCYGCHASDDTHQGSFGRTCESCHNTTSFKQGAVRR